MNKSATLGRTSLEDAWCIVVVDIPKETLINSSFRAKRSGDPESSAFFSICYWIIRCALPVGRLLGVQRATRFCPAYAGMTGK